LYPEAMFPSPPIVASAFLIVAAPPIAIEKLGDSIFSDGSAFRD